MDFRDSFFYAGLAAIKRSLQVVHILFRRQGLLRSMLAARPVAADGAPLPWFTYPAIEYLGQFDFSSKKVFEYGAGNSSLFWARRAATVVAVESDERWYRHVAAAKPANLTLHLAPARDDYVGAIDRGDGPFDVIVIDGRWRNACARVCASHIRDGGLIILDNADRGYAAADELRRLGFFRIDFNGFSPINGYASTTSVFIKAATDLQANFAAPRPVGGLGERAGEDD